MNLNYLAFFLISFLPIIIGYFWYKPGSSIATRFGVSTDAIIKLSIPKLFILFVFSVALVYGYMNLVIHQLGFYELFFTDIMIGNEASKVVVEEFMSKYGDKHRHFGHGVLHGAINAFLFALPFVGLMTILEGKNKKYFQCHFSYWLVTSMVIGGLISQFV